MVMKRHFSWKLEEEGQAGNAKTARCYTRFMHQLEQLNAKGSQDDASGSMFTGASVRVEGSRHTDDFINSLRTAWLHLRHEAPIHATTTETVDIHPGEDGRPAVARQRFRYTVPEAEDIDTWLHETFLVFKRSRTSSELLDIALEGRSTLVAGRGHHAGLIHVTQATEDPSQFHVLYAALHCITDARGSFMTLNRLFALAANLPSVSLSPNLVWGEEVDRLFPPAVYAAGLRTDCDAPPVDLQAWLRDREENVRASRPECTMKTKATDRRLSDTTPTPILAEFVADPELHRLVTAAGKLNGTSVTGIVAGLLALITYKHRVRSNPGPKSVVIWGAATDRRAFLEDRFNPYYGQCIWSKNVYLRNIAAIEESLSALDNAETIPSSFWTVCKEFKNDLDAFARDRTSFSIADEIVNPPDPKTAGVFSSPPAAQIFYSSYGKIDNVLQRTHEGETSKLLVNAPSCMALFHLSPMIAASTSSWQGTLKIFLQLSQLHYTRSFADLLVSELGDMLQSIGHVGREKSRVAHRHR